MHLLNNTVLAKAITAIPVILTGFLFYHASWKSMYDWV